MSPVFAHGRLRLYLLKLLDDGPKHGYELIRLLEDRFHGHYAPSAGTNTNPPDTSVNDVSRCNSRSRSSRPTGRFHGAPSRDLSSLIDNTSPPSISMTVSRRLLSVARAIPR